MVPQVVLKPQREKSVERQHPWVFSGAIAKTPKGLADGDLVDVRDHQGRCLGLGHFFDSTIAVRLITFTEEPISASFWERKIAAAYAVRRTVGLIQHSSTTALRLVNGEGDGLSGLIIDLYGSTAVLQCHSLGMWRARVEICSALRAVLGDRVTAVYDKSAEALKEAKGEEIGDGYLFGAPGQGEISENGHRFRVDWEQGQKTGFFLDQRENRAWVGAYAADRTVLNAFSYTAGFSVYALCGGARSCHSVDSSKSAIALGEENVALNGVQSRHSSSVVDCLPYLKEAANTYDCIVLDPPAFAKHQRHADQALKGYRSINEAALRCILPRGLLFTFSCSQAVDRESFRSVVFSAAVNARRSVQVLRELGHGPDHPVSLFHPEGEYLKGLLLQVG